jgi:hypothetical protein
MFLWVASLVGTLVAVTTFLLLERKGRDAWKIAGSEAAPLGVRSTALSALFLGQAALLVVLFPLVAHDADGARIPLDGRTLLFIVGELVVSLLLWVAGAQLLLRSPSVPLFGRIATGLSLAVHGAIFGVGAFEIGRIPAAELRPLAALFILGFPALFGLQAVCLGVVVEGLFVPTPENGEADTEDAADDR